MRIRAKDGGALPDTGCPMSRRRWQGKRGATCTDNSGTAQARASHTSHMHSFTGGVSRVIPSKRVLSEGVRVDVEEVVEVDVLGRRGK